MITKCKSIFIVFALLVVYSSRIPARCVLKENDPCATTHYEGRCTTEQNCPDIFETMNRMRLSALHVGYCNFMAYEKFICCPNALEKMEAITEALTPTTLLPAISTTVADKNVEASTQLNPSFGNTVERPAALACKKIEEDLMPILIPHILNGYEVKISQYPHMAKIIYDSPKHKCSGILIHKGFILTAAHCLLKRGVKPTKVIMGITDFEDPNEWDNRQEIMINRTYYHPEYSSEKLYNDIGLIELVEEVNYSMNVYPTCLQTDPTDLLANTELIVTGWGLTENHETSSHLNAASLLYVPLPQCSASYMKQLGENDIQLDRGIVNTHLCAFSNQSDACDGDSGGPVHIVINKTYNNYRVVGIVASGILCGAHLPGIYTRVSEFLNFIEAIVWPSSKQ